MSTIRDLGRVGVGLLLFLLLGCQSTRAAALPPLPTLHPRAIVAQRAALLPPTFTPPAAAVPAHMAAATPRPSPTLAPSATPLPTPPPTVVAQVPAAPVAAGAPPATTACDGTGVVIGGRFVSHLGWRSYSAYLPPCYGDGRVYPVLYLFHGSIQTDSHWLDLGLAQVVDEGIAGGRYPPFIVIMPFNGELGNMTSGGDVSIEAVTVNHLLPFVDRTFCSWAARSGRSLGGISRGGYWALEIAFRHTNLFGAVAGHSSHLRLETDAATYNPLATYAAADLSAMRIWLDWGETDFLRPGQEQLRDALSAAAVPLQATVFPGGHNDGYWRSHLRTYLDWHAAAWPLNRDAYPACTTAP